MDASTQNQQPKLPPPPGRLPPPPNSKTPDGRERLHQIVSVAIEVATKHGHPDQVRAIQQLYEQSKTDTFIAELMDVVLARKATPEQYSHFQAYMKNLREEAPKSSIPEAAISQGQQDDQRPLEFKGGAKEGMGNMANTMEQPYSGNPHDRVVEGDTGSSLDLVSSEHQSIVGPGSRSKAVVLHPEVSTKTTPEDKKKGTIVLNQKRAKAKEPLAKSEGEAHPILDSHGDTEYYPPQRPGAEVSRSSKRLKTIHEEGKPDVQPLPSGEKEGVINNAGGPKMSSVPTSQTLFNEALSDRDFLPKVIDGCMTRSAKAGYAEIGHAIKSFYEESLVDPSLEGFFEGLITGRIDPEPVLYFQEFVREYVRDSRKAYPNEKPTVEGTASILDRKGPGFTVGQSGEIEVPAMDPEDVAPHQNSTVISDPLRSSVGNEATTSAEVSAAAHKNNSLLPAVLQDVASIPVPHTIPPHPAILPPGVSSISEIPGPDGHPQPPANNGQ